MTELCQASNVVRQAKGDRHGFRQRRAAMVNWHSAANHHHYRTVYAPLKLERCKHRGRQRWSHSSLFGIVTNCESAESPGCGVTLSHDKAGADSGTVAMKRCHQCNGRFGLVRYRFELKQFCSKRCLLEYRAHSGRGSPQIKQPTENTEIRVHEKAH